MLLSMIHPPDISDIHIQKNDVLYALQVMFVPTTLAVHHCDHTFVVIFAMSVPHFHLPLPHI